MKKQNLIIAIVILLLVGVGIGLNYMFEANQVTVDDDGGRVPNLANRVNPTTPPPPAPTTPTAPPKVAPAAVPVAKSAPSVILPSEAQYGSSKAATTVALGYTMDASTAANPANAEAVVQALTDWSKSHPDVKVKVVSLDLPKEEMTDPSDQNLPLGLSVNGKSVAGMTGNPGESILTAQTVTGALSTVR
jgi:hypothetical protein